MTKNNKWEGLKGIWETEGEDSRALIEISEKRGKPHVVVFDKIDGEKFKVTNVRIESGFLCYEVCVPSNNYKTRHRLRLKARNKIEQELTFTETWVRKNLTTEKKQNTPGKRS